MRLVLVLLLVLACAAVPARAATVSLSFYETEASGRAGPTVWVYSVGVVDDAGEANRLRIRGAELLDEAVPLRPGPGCARGDGGWVSCPAPGPASSTRYRVDAALGDGDDVVATEGDGTLGSLDLGAGDDRTDLGWTVLGGVSGGPGDDVLRGTGAAYLTWDGGPGADRASGAGVTVTYGSRTAPVQVTPDGVADDGEPGEGDDVAPDVLGILGGPHDDALWSSGGSVGGGLGDDVITGLDRPRPLPSHPSGEELDGGDGDDVITGRGGPDKLVGFGGDDRLDGGAGDDTFDDGSGADVVDGGPGDDTVAPLRASDGSADRFRGGAGRDLWRGWNFDLRPRATPRVSLDGRADDGLPGERDDVAADFERVSLDRGVLVGGDGPDELEVLGAGTIDGRGGDDRLRGGGDLTGGPGRDELHRVGVLRSRAVIDTRDGEPDRIRCAGPVGALRRDPGDTARGCGARAVTGRALVRRGELRSGGVVATTVRCAGHQVCRGALTLRSLSGRAVGRARFVLAGGREQAIAVRLGRRARLLRASCGRARVQITSRDAFEPGRTRTSSRVRTVGAPLRRCRRG